MTTDYLHHLTRRHFLQQSQLGLGSIALSSLLAGDGCRRHTSVSAAGVVNPLAPRQPHFPAKAKQVIYLHLTGSPPNLDLYDYKPELVKRDGQDCPDTFLKGRTFAFTTGVPKLLGTPRKFAQHGEGRPVDVRRRAASARASPTRCASIHSMYTEQFNHAPAELLLYTGSPRSGRPAMGAWVDLWTGDREREPARLRRADLQRRAAQRRQELLRQRLSALGVSGRAVPLEGRSGAVCLRPAGHGPRPAPPEPRRPARPQRAASPRAGPSRNADAHRPVRAGLPHADRRCPR